MIQSPVILYRQMYWSGSANGRQGILEFACVDLILERLQVKFAGLTSGSYVLTCNKRCICTSKYTFT